MRDMARRYPDEPYRRRLGAITERLRRTRAYLTEEGGPIGGRYEGRAAGRRARRDAALPGRGSAAAGRLREVQDFRWQVETFGFHLAALEIRQHSEVHEAAVAAVRDLAAELVPGVNVAEVIATSERPRLSSAASARTRATRYVISFTRSAEDVLRVLDLVAIAGDAAIPAAATGGLAPARRIWTWFRCSNPATP